MEVAAAMGAVGLLEGPGRVNAVLELPGVIDELTRVHRLRRLEQGRLFPADSGAAQVLGGSRHHGHMLVGDLAAGEGLLGLRQLLQLARDADALGGRSRGEATPGAQPIDQRDRAVGFVLA